MKKWLMILGAICLLSFSGCGGSAATYDMASNSSGAADVTTNYTMEKSEIVDSYEAVEENGYEVAAGDAGGSEIKPANEQISRKLIVTEYLTVETKEFDDFLTVINQKTETLGGYIENSEISGTTEYQDKYANLRIRIPEDKLGEFVTVVDNQGTVLYDSKSTEDVTLQYVDTESHLNALKTEETTLLTLLEKAEKLSDVFEIQERLTQVRYEIESYTSQLRVYDNQVDYSTVELTVREVARETMPEREGFWAEAMSRFSDSLYFVGRALRGFAIWLIGNIPVFAVWAVLITFIVLLIKRRRKRIRLKKQQNGTSGSDVTPWLGMPINPENPENSKSPEKE